MYGKMLLTGASGMLGRYVRPIFDGQYAVTTLQRSDADICCDLRTDIPDFGDKIFDLVVHCAGSTEDEDAVALNHEGTRHLLKALEINPPREFVYVSSWEVYSSDSGENVDEEHQLWASSKVGQSKALAEDAVGKWCVEHGVLLTVVRPARMMGKGVHGEMKRLFDDVVGNRYIHVRGNEARLSLVCAYDVAHAIDMLHSIGGIYNLCDGVGASWIELAEGMSANCGAMKRQTFLPPKWAEAAWRFAAWIPAVKASLSPELLSRRSKTLTLSDEKISSMFSDWHPFTTITVIKRECENYPYLD